MRKRWGIRRALRGALLCLFAALLCPERSVAQDAPLVAHDVPFSPIEAILLKSVLIAINQANQANNYAILRGMLSKEFAASYTTARLSDLFKPWRAKNRDFGFVAIAFPSFDRQPSIDAKGRLRLQGSIPTPSFRVAFDFMFKRKDNRWALDVLALSDGVTTISTEALGANVASSGGTAGDDVVGPADGNKAVSAKLDSRAKPDSSAKPDSTKPDSAAPSVAVAVTGDTSAESPASGAVPTTLPPLPRKRPWP